MGSWVQVVGQAFNALTLGRAARVERLAWASSQSGSSGSLSGAEPSTGESACDSQHVSGLGASPGGSKQDAGQGASPGNSKQVSGLGASPASATKRLARQRMQYLLSNQQELGREACEFRDSFFKESGSMYGWVCAFLAQRFHFDDLRLPVA